MLIDRYNRVIDNLRILVTGRCNLECFFCHREGGSNGEGELSAEDIEFVVRIATSLGIDKVKLTGGEPLIRDDIVDIIERIAGIKGVRDLSMATNGTLLAEKACELRKAGLRRINISLHSLNEETYKRITGRDLLHEVLEGLEAASKCGFDQVKVNVVLLRGINDGELDRLMEIAHEKGVVLQLIELESKRADDPLFMNYHVSLEEIRKRLESESIMIIRRSVQNRPIFRLKNGGIVELVAPVEDKSFCLKCTKIRLTHDGVLKPCLFSDEGVNVLEYIRERNIEALKRSFLRVVELKRPFFPEIWGVHDGGSKDDRYRGQKRSTTYSHSRGHDKATEGDVETHKRG